MVLAVRFQLKQLKKQPEKMAIAQWIEHCTGIARSWVRVPFKPELFFRLLFQLLKLKAHCGDHNFTYVYPQFTYMILIYSGIFMLFTTIGYMTNSQLTICPCGLIAQWIEQKYKNKNPVARALHRYRKVMGSSPVQA